MMQNNSNNLTNLNKPNNVTGQNKENNQNHESNPNNLKVLNNPNPADITAQVLELLREERILRYKAEAQLEAQQGKVLFADAVNASKESILVRELAVILKQSGVQIGEAGLFDWLRGNGYLTRQPSGRNQPTQKSLSLGVIEMKQTVNINAYGKSSVTCTPKITPKGRNYFYHKVMADKERINAIEAAKKAEKKAEKKVAL